jgi:phosphatidylserine/phosphatidylglycerophosphate/cardiolipin synthase-like enzyme
VLLDVAHARGDAGDDWFAATDGSASGDDMGNVWVRGIEHGPDERFEKLADVIAAALASVRQQVWILTPYFLPSASLIQGLNLTAMHGVDVDITTAGEPIPLGVRPRDYRREFG